MPVGVYSSEDSGANASEPERETGLGRFARFALGFALFLLVLGCLALADRPVYEYLHEHFNVYTRPVPNHMKIAVRVLRSMEDWGESVYILAVAFAMWRLDRRRRSRVLCIALGAILVALPVELVKRLTGRVRPEESYGKLEVHGWSKWSDGGDYQSFPSGHTASGAAYSGALAAFYPPLRPVCIALAVGCGANRVWKERHFLTDCWVGGIFGFWFAFTLPRRRFMQPLRAWFDRCFSVPPTPDSVPMPRVHTLSA